MYNENANNVSNFDCNLCYNKTFSILFSSLIVILFGYISYVIMKPKRENNMNFEKYYILDTNILPRRCYKYLQAFKKEKSYYSCWNCTWWNWY